MTQLWMDGFDHYGVGSTGEARMLEGPWAEVTSVLSDGLGVPSFGARTGSVAFGLRATASENLIRRVLGADKTTVIVSTGFYLTQIPVFDSKVALVSFCVSGTACAGTVYVQSDGSLLLRGTAASRAGFDNADILASTTGPALVSGTWHHVEISFTQNASAGACEIRVDEKVVMTATALNTGATALNQLIFGYLGGSTTTSLTSWYDDTIVRDTLGSVNNGFLGDLRVATLQPIANGVAQGWTTRSIQKLGTGVLHVDDNGSRNSSVTFADNAALEIGSSSYAIEGFFRFEDIPVLSEEMALASKYNTDSSNVSWLLSVFGPDAGGTIEFRTSSDGTLGDLVTVHTFPFIPIANRWYHMAVTRDGTTSRLFIDGVQKGINQTDSRTYFNGNAAVAISGRMSSTTVVSSNTGLEGWVDGFRMTIGSARYTGNFAPPTAALPTDLSGDSLYNSVALLMNFDNNATTDQSTNAFTGTLRNGAVQDVPNDGAAFQTIDGLTPNDFDFVEADLIAATGTLDLTANPLNTETVTLGSVTYTFQTVLVDAANNVLIGAAATNSLDNLRAAVNLESGSGTLYGTGTVINPNAGLSDLPDDQILATASAPGAAGNSIATTETLTNGSWSAATLLGGLDIPSNSEFTLSALPPEVTGVRAVAIVNRAFKTDSGSSSLQTSFVESGGTSSQGAARPVTTSPTYYEDTFETAPSGGALTPSTVNNSRIRLNRTV